MLTAAITGAIVAVLDFFGVPPGPYIVGLAIGVKITIVGVIALVSWRMVRKRQKAAAAAVAADKGAPGGGAPPPA